MGRVWSGAALGFRGAKSQGFRGAKSQGRHKSGGVDRYKVVAHLGR